MNNRPSWPEQNDAYLSAALTWLRLRLERAAPRLAEQPVATPLSSPWAASSLTASPLAAYPPAAMPSAPGTPGSQTTETRMAMAKPVTATVRRGLFRREVLPPVEVMAATDLMPPAAIVLPTSETIPDTRGAEQREEGGQAQQTEQVDQVLQRAEIAMDEAAKCDPPPALLLVQQRFGLTRFERDLLLLCAAQELDTRIVGLCARVHDDPAKSFPTFSLALAVLSEPAWEALSPERPLRYWRLLEIGLTSGQPLTASPLRADERIVNAIKGLNHLDDRLLSFLAPPSTGSEAPPLSPSQETIARAMAARMSTAVRGQRPPVVQLVGADTASKLAVARRAAAVLGLHLYRIAAEAVPSSLADLEQFMRLWGRETALLPVGLYIDAQQAEQSSADKGPSPLLRFLARCEGLVVLDVNDVWTQLGRDQVTFDVSKPTPDEQYAAWLPGLSTATPEQTSEQASRLAGQFSLTLDTIQRISALAGGDPERMWDECRASVRPRLEALSQRIEAKATWDDLVLPPEQEATLHRIAAQVGNRSTVYHEWGFARRMNRGMGISALFAGDSGTGKTMAAEVLANDLRLDLYRIDLSAVVNKYLGETEKNLRRLFDAAEEGGAILFFDEADALFGKRSEVKDSHDRYANIEINYLLQRMEGYRGLAILATNLKSSLDQAFLRRLRFVIDFPFPGVAERRRMWERAFPIADRALGIAGAPLDDLDYDRLGRLTLTGGNIHSAALMAAFTAVQIRSPVTMPLVLQAARAELKKLERPVNEAEFRWPRAVTVETTTTHGGTNSETHGRNSGGRP